MLFNSVCIYKNRSRIYRHTPFGGINFAEIGSPTPTPRTGKEQECPISKQQLK